MTRRRTNPLARVAIWGVKKLPPPLVRDTERIGLSLGFMAVGTLSAILVFNHEVRPLSSPVGIVILWAVALFIGGLFTIIGIWSGNRVTERFGMMMAMIGCLAYGLASVAAGWDGPRRLLITGVLFLLFAVVKMIRLAASTAASSTVNGDEGSRE